MTKRASRAFSTIVFACLCASARAGDDAASPPNPSAGGPAVQELPEINVIGTSPVVGTGIPSNLYPGNAQTISARKIAPGSTALSDTLNQQVGSANVNDTQGNPYQVDFNFRGYTASPVLGTPQGLSVFVDGVRINEPFGDIVSWDLIPQIAIANITVIPGTNPVYGLNTLGGAIAVNTKSGFAFPGSSVSLGSGSFDRRAIDAEQGGHGENVDYFIAASFFDDNGWAKTNPSLVRQLFTKIGFQDDHVDLDFSMTYVDDYLSGNQTVAKSMLNDAISGYSHPDFQPTRSFAANVTGKFELAAHESVEGNLYFRDIWRLIYNSNIQNPVLAGSPDQPEVCLALYGSQCAGNVASDYTQHIGGINAQYTNTMPIASHTQYFTLGVNAERAHTTFAQAAQDAIITSSYATIGDDPFVSQSAIGSDNSNVGVYASETFLVTSVSSITLSLRHDHSDVSLSGTSVDNNGDPVSVDGAHSYARTNPAIGGTWMLAPAATLFANYAQGIRTPSAIELACADPVHPCAGVPSAFSSDPALKAVVAHSFELGARGAIGDGVHWRASVFESTLSNDILFNQSSLTTGYFSNVGKTRREGLELSFDGAAGTLDYAAALTWMRATYQSAFLVSNPANAGANCPGPTCVPVEPGDSIPGIPDLLGKFLIGYHFTPALRGELRLYAESSTFARGDENNLLNTGKVPGFATVRLGFSDQINKTLELSAGIENLFNRQYASFGILSNNDLSGGRVENFLGLGAPRTFFVDLKATF